MIIEPLDVGGRERWLVRRDNAQSTNLGTPSAGAGRTSPLVRGEVLDVSGLFMILESEESMTKLLARQQEPLLSFTVMKEMFPDLFADPFSNYVHTIAGYEDLHGGTIKNGRVADFEGVATLWSLGPGGVRWTSRIYTPPQPIDVKHVSWELGIPRNGLGFEYSLTLYYWPPGAPLDSGPSSIPLAGSAGPNARRAKAVQLDEPVASYRIVFVAKNDLDPQFQLRDEKLLEDSLGAPLLRGVNILEARESRHTFWSVGELLSESARHSFIGPGERLLYLEFGLTPNLVFSDRQDVGSEVYEYLEVDVVSPKLKNVQAWLSADLLRRAATVAE